MITIKDVVQYFIDNGSVGSILNTSGQVKAKVYYLSKIPDKDIERWIYSRIKKYVMMKIIYDDYDCKSKLKANREYYKTISGLMINTQGTEKICNVSLKIPQDVIPELAYDKIVLTTSLVDIQLETLDNIELYISTLKKSMEEKHTETINEILLDLGKEEQAWEDAQKEIKECGL